MRFAQRSPGFNPEPEQQIKHFKGTTSGEVVTAIRDMVDKYAIRVVHITAWAVPAVPGLHGLTNERHFAIVVFEEEPIRR